MGNDNISELLSSAENYFRIGDYERAGALYNQVAEKDSKNWKGVFFSVYCAARTCTLGEIPKYIDILLNCSTTIPPMICENLLLDMERVRTAFLDYFKHWLEINEILVDNLRSLWEKNSSSEYKSNYLKYSYMAYVGQLNLAKNWLTNPTLKNEFDVPSFTEPLIQMILYIYDLYNAVHNSLHPNISYIFDIKVLDDVLTAYKKAMYLTTFEPFIREIKPDYVNPIVKKYEERIAYLKSNPNAEEEAIRKHKQENGGCYVATAIYGSYDCPEVWTLRRYRDYTLAASWYGRTFIKTYYAISPTLVKWFGHTKWFRNMWKPTLDRIVKGLNSKGVDNTAYDDKKW